MNEMRRESGYTIVEILVALMIFSVVSAGFYSFLFAGTRASRTTEDVARISEEARAGLNRMIRDTREGQLFDQLQGDSYRVRVDFDGDGVYENPNESGDFEEMNFEYIPADRTITLNDEVLIRGVERIDASTDVFSYTSNDLRYDWDGNGVTTGQELDEAGTRGYAGVSSSDASLYSNVNFAFSVRVGEKVTSFRGQAQLRNRR